MIRKMAVLISVFSVFVMLTATYASAQSFPSKAITFLCPFAAGSGNDVVARIISEKLAARLGQPVVVENRVGASGSLAAEGLMKAPPDGHTIFIASTSLATNMFMTKVSYDLVKDFEPIIFVGKIPFVVVANPAVPAKTMGELVALAKAKPGKLTFSAGSIGSTGHLWVESLKMEAGVDMVFVPYKSASDAIADFLGGRLDLWLPSLPYVTSYLNTGKIRALAVAGTHPKRVALMPEVPTMTEAGFPALDEIYSWYAILAPLKTPKQVVTKLNGEIKTILGMADVKEKLAAVGAEVSPSTPEETGKFLRADLVKWDKMMKTMKAAGIKLTE